MSRFFCKKHGSGNAKTFQLGNKATDVEGQHSLVELASVN